MKGSNMIKKIPIFLTVGLLVTSCAAIPGLGAAFNSRKYEMIVVQDLQNMMETEEIMLINVHIPLEGNIPETDLEIPFDEVESYLSLLPENKDEKIIVYCRSGSMGDTASQTLIDLGYSDVSNLEGGYNAWKAANLPFEE